MRRPVPRRVPVLAAVLAGLLAAPLLPAAAATAAADGGWQLVGPPAPSSGGVVARTAAEAPSSFAVIFEGIDPEAQAAVLRATATLGASLASAVPVTVRVTRGSLPAGALGAGTPGLFAARDADGSYDPTDTLYPIGLANALAGKDLDPGGADVQLVLSDTAPFWTGETRPPADRYDLTSVALHELLHGLGLTASLRVEGGVGTWGDPADPVGPTPVVFDRFVVNATSPDAVVSSAVLRRPIRTRDLADALTAPVYWDGPQARAALGGRRPRLESGASFLLGTSLVHLPESEAPAGTPNAVLSPVLGLGETTRLLGPVVLGMLADTGWAVPALPGSRYTPVDPRRLLDTRSGLGQGGVKRTLGPGRVLDLQVAGGATGVPLGATAVVLNVTGVAPSASTDVRVYPTPRTAETVPEVSTLNLVRGRTRANLVTVPVGLDGRVRLRNSSGTVSLLADLQGFYAADGASLFHPVAPVRLLDTRSTRLRTLGPGQVLDLQVAGERGVPAGAQAVVLGLTGVGASLPTDLRAYPTPASGSPVPVVSNVNLRPGGPVAASAVVRVGSSGRVRFRNAAGAVALLVDLQGWFDAASPGGLSFRPVRPQRVLDTRTLSTPRLGAGQVLDVALSGRAGVPGTAQAVVLNLTGIGATRSTDLRAYPSPTGTALVPTVSTLNLTAGQTAANAAVVATGSLGRVRVRNQSGGVGVAVDVAGWFAP
ncbi:MAG: N-acetylmuramoyl-L-alanine amidase [Frankiales bacterium]|nr:N-acetylmuramoyl-L-alanine amidase [Frankiales bacterium]